MTSHSIVSARITWVFWITGRWHFSPLPSSSCYVTLLCCCCEMRVCFAPFSSSFWLLRVAFSLYAYIYIYIYALSSSGTYMSYVKEKKSSTWMFELFPFHTGEQHNVTILHLVQLQYGQEARGIWAHMAFDAKNKLGTVVWRGNNLGQCSVLKYIPTVIS